MGKSLFRMLKAPGSVASKEGRNKGRKGKGETACKFLFYRHESECSKP